MTEREMADEIASYLESEGFRPTVDKDNDVVFKCEGRTYLVQVDEADPLFFRITFPNFWSVESEDERARVLEVASEVSKAVKVAKVFIVRDDTWASVELFGERPDSYRALFNRAMGALQVAVSLFKDKMREPEY